MAVFPSDSIRTKNWGTEILTDADLEAQLDLLHAYFQAALNATTGHTHDGTSNQGPKLTPANLVIASQAQGDVLYASSATVWARLGAGTSGQFLKTQGAAANPIWADLTAPSGGVVQMVNTSTGAVATGTTTVPNDDTIPQNTEGTEFMTRAITPTNSSNLLRIDVHANCSWSEASQISIIMALFQDTTANALNATMNVDVASVSPFQLRLTHWMTAGTTSSTTFKVRIGPESAGTVTLNGVSGARKLGGVNISSITITEIKA